MKQPQPDHLIYKCPDCEHEWTIQLTWYKGHPNIVEADDDRDPTDCPSCNAQGYEK